MPVNREFVGRSYDANEVYEVAREKIRQFADAIGDPNPAFRDPAAARALGHPDVIAPPTFLTVLGFRFPAAGPVLDPDFGLDYSRVVHGEQRYELHRPVYAGDRLRSRLTVEDIRDAGRNELVVLRTDVTSEAGEPVATGRSTIVSRGTAAPRGGAG
jgi:acyl dehydratase